MQSYSKKRDRKGSPAKFGNGLRLLTVRARPGVPAQGLLNVGGVVFPCALGPGGISTGKREGDGTTPLGAMRLLYGYVRGDRFARRSPLPLEPITPALGWCEVSDDRNYNRPVNLPYAASHERMLRADNLYDACIVLDWNIMPRRRGRGSAIFFHLARPGFTPTQGCVAVSHAVMARLLPRLSRRTVMVVKR
jgi:L,D-peptidoglycan transpeptidase YkuD (ErfK/YbiS/YcfS/YnhG family)